MGLCLSQTEKSSNVDVREETTILSVGVLGMCPLRIRGHTSVPLPSQITHDVGEYVAQWVIWSGGDLGSAWSGDWRHGTGTLC